MTLRIVPLAALSLCGALSLSAHAQTAQEGKAAFVACTGCHSVDGSAKPTGPTLKGVVGRKAAGVAAYRNYSAALRGSAQNWLIVGVRAIRTRFAFTRDGGWRHDIVLRCRCLAG